MPFFNVIRWIVWKDIISEIRSRENISSMFFFSLIVIFILSFSIDSNETKSVIPGVIWVAFGFTSIIGLGRCFLMEVSNDCIEYFQMAPIVKGTVYLGKLIGNSLFLFCVELILYPLFILFFNLDIIEKLPGLLLASVPATLGLSALGTLFSALTAHVRAREVMFPVLLMPLSVPVFIGAVQATKGILNGDPFNLYFPWVELLIVFDVVFVVTSFWLFEYILDY